MKMYRRNSLLAEVAAARSSRGANVRMDAAFSLVEILTVIALIAILTSLALGGVEALRGRALDNAGNKITQVFETARQLAMSGNTPTAVVLITKAGIAEDGRAFAILDYSAADGVWKQIGPWEILPEGLCIDIGNDPVADTFVSLSDPAGVLPSASGSFAAFRGRNLASGQYAFRVFLPSGGLWNASGNPARLQLVEGSVENGVTRRRGAVNNYYRISLVAATGYPKVERPDL